MIPTSATSSSPPTASLGCIGSQLNHSPTLLGSANTSNGTGGTGGGGQKNSSAFLGIASLILEGRALAYDEYVIQTTRNEYKISLSGNSPECGRQSPKPSTSRAAFADSLGSSVGGSSANSSFSIDLANYLGRKSSNSPESISSSSFLRDYYSSSGESAASSVESNHSRWSQKLSQLRQESPNAHHQVLAAQQKVTIECPRGSDAEYVALAINTDHHGTNEERRGGDFEILRRMSINQMNFYNSPHSMGIGGGGVGIGIGAGGGGSNENFMCSLQSLASNTCLRVGSPLLATTTSPPRYSYNKQISSTSARFSTPSNQQLEFSTRSASSSCDNGGVSANSWHPSSSPSCNKSCNNKDYLLRKTSTKTQRMDIPATQTANSKIISNSCTPSHNLPSNIFSRNHSSVTKNTNCVTVATAATTATTSSIESRNKTYPQQGPHCDQFLKKMGLAKGDASDTEEHHCDMSYVNITCTRWRAYCIKMENILARGEPICIEVYLGPVGHKILLEQWIITQNEKQPPPTMTLPSLCSAIRSQLYFSQISAWCDLIKKSDKTIYETGRVIFTTPPTTSAAGDLAITTSNPIATSTTITTSAQHPTSTPPTSAANSVGGAGVGCVKRRPSAPRLNIFYRIKQYDSTACFNSKPNVHNFPNVNISENCSVSVCLKSLPRITGGIPKVGTTAIPQQQPQNTATTTSKPPVRSTTPTCLAAKNKIPATTAATTDVIAAAVTVSVAATGITTNANKSTILIMNCDNNLKEHQQQKSLTASSTRCSLSINVKNSKSASNKVDHQHNQDKDFTDFGYEDQNEDLSAGGDNSFLSCGNGTVGGANVGDCDSSNSSFSTNNCGNLSHREKQLLKYRKRMLRRDKKQQHKTSKNISTNETNISTNKLKNESEIDNGNNKMEQGEEYEYDEGDGDGEDDDEDEDDVNNEGNNSDTANYSKRNHSVNNLAKGQRQQLPNNYINSIPPISQQQHHQHVKMISTGTQTITNTCTACGSEKSMICLKCNPLKLDNDNAVTTTALHSTVSHSSYNYEEEVMDAETSSSASSLSSSDIIHTPRNKAELLLQAIQRTPKSNKKHKHKSKDSSQMAAIKQDQQQHSTITTNRNNRHRTSPHNFNTINEDRNSGHSNSATTSSNINDVVGINNGNSNNMVGCQVCKRQKTQHHFNQPLGEELNSDDNNFLANNSFNSSTDHNTITLAKNTTQTGGVDAAAGDDNDEGDNETDDGKSYSTNCVDNISIVIDSDSGGRTNGVVKMSTKSFDNFENEVMEEEYFESSTKLTPHIERCSLNTDRIEYQTTRSTCSTPPLEEQNENRASRETPSMMAQFKTPTPSEQHLKAIKSKTQQQQPPQQPHKLTPKPNLLHIACNFNRDNEQQMSKLKRISNSSNSVDNNTPTTTHNPLLLRRSLPKVNLTPIFCNPNSMMVVSSSPIPIGGGVLCNSSSNSFSATKSADISITEASPTFSFESPSSPAPSLTVQKSNSAPTLPNSPSLSPRFVKASAIYKRRSRHLSDRSDRSSLGSDEQFSDEDVDGGMYSPFATSPVKLRNRLAAVFGRKSLLGNLEECLLQRRLVPKIEVMGFKLLLGASGGFCPTQLTIPAAAYFYELKGETLSTPYLCEIRLPRKGYTVPRCGTVQATLLNPMGTVVRMFVIPYDMRDMPTLHQTFIRQRILADSGLQSNNDFTQNGQIDKHFNDDATSIATMTTKAKLQERHQEQHQEQQQHRSPTLCNSENHLGHFISAENMKSLRYSIHLRFQTSRTGRLMLHTDIRLLISRRTDCDTAAAHAKGVLEAPNELITNTVMPTNPKYSARQDQTSSKI